MEKLKKLSNHQLYTLCLYRVTKNFPSLDKENVLDGIRIKAQEHPLGVLGYLIKPGERLSTVPDFSELYLIALDFDKHLSLNKALSECHSICKEVKE